VETSAPAPAPDTIPGIAKGNADLSTLVAALEGADLVKTLQQTGPFTVFAPSNAAFNSLGFGGAKLTYLLNNKAQLTEVLEYHVTAGKIISNTLKDGEQINMLAGGSTTVTITPSPLGIIGEVKINEAKLTTPNVMASNGVVHIIDQVLIPKDFSAPNIPAVAESIKSLSIFGTALAYAGLVDALQGGPLTVFAPTNEAFAALPAGVLEKLLLPANKESLQQVLKYHVHNGELQSKDFKNRGSITTLEDKDLKIAIGSGRVQVLGGLDSHATVTLADQFAFNGIVHIIDAVLLPSDWVAPTSTEASSAGLAAQEVAAPERTRGATQQAATQATLSCHTAVHPEWFCEPFETESDCLTVAKWDCHWLSGPPGIDHGERCRCGGEKNVIQAGGVLSGALLV